jgi:hypothetical protein
LPARDLWEPCIGWKTNGFGEVARFLQSIELLLRILQAREGFMEPATTREYDVHSAITFFLVGVGVGSLLTIVFNPKNRVTLEGINGWRRAA